VSPLGRPGARGAADGGRSRPAGVALQRLGELGATCLPQCLIHELLDEPVALSGREVDHGARDGGDRESGDPDSLGAVEGRHVMDDEARVMTLGPDHGYVHRRRMRGANAVQGSGGVVGEDRRGPAGEQRGVLRGQPRASARRDQRVDAVVDAMQPPAAHRSCDRTRRDAESARVHPLKSPKSDPFTSRPVADKREN
jgi:hypothetical protein